MPYIGNPIYQSAFVTDQFSGNGSTTAFTMSVAPAGVSNVLVAVSGVLQDPSTYGVVGNTITFSTAPPSGTGNISCRYLGVPVTGIVTTAYRTVTEFTATASQTTFTPPSYTVGFINVYLNGVLLGSADYTATNGTTVVLATGASAGNLVTVESFRVETVLNAISNSAGSVGTTNIADGAITTAKIASGVTVNFADGSASAPSITNDGDTNTGMFFPAADTIAFAEGGAEIARFDSSGNLGIGTSSPNNVMTTYRGSGVNNYIQFTNQTTGTTSTDGCLIGVAADDTALRLRVLEAAPMIFTTSDTERMRITSAGNVSIGTTSSGGKLTVWDGNINVNWGGGYLSSIDRGITILAGGYNDTTNKARIVHIGGVGDNNNRCGWTAYSIKTNTVNNGAEYYIRPVTWNGTAFVEQTSAGVYLTDNATSWTSASDERLKENLEPIANAVEKVKTIRAVTGKYKVDTDGTSRAFLIAQDVQAVLPEAVTKNSEGYLGLAYTETIPLLVAAIKEQQAMIEELKTKVAALEAK